MVIFRWSSTRCRWIFCKTDCARKSKPRWISTRSTTRARLKKKTEDASERCWGSVKKGFARPDLFSVSDEDTVRTCRYPPCGNVFEPAKPNYWHCCWEHYL